MTTSTITRPANATTSRSFVIPGLLGLAGVAWWLGQTLLPDMGMEWADRLAAVAAARDRQAAAAALFFIAGWSLVLAAVAAIRRVPSGSRLTTIGVACLGLGGVWLAALRGAFTMTLYQATDPQVPVDAALALVSVESVAFFAILPMLPALLLGPIALAVGLRRAAMTGWLPLALWLVGIGTFVAAEFTIKAAESAGIAVAASALVLMGLALSRPSH